jgi:hypothetical protein
VLVYSAWFFGGQIDWVVSVARRTEHGILLALLIAGTVFGVRAWRKHKKRLATRTAAEASGAGPPSSGGGQPPSSSDSPRV